MHIEIKDLQSGQTHRIDDKGTTLGRDKARATIAVPESGVSGLHARIAPKDNKWFLEDLGSSNGTFIDKDRIPKGQPVQLERGTQFKFHTYRFEVIDIDPDGDGKTQVFSGDTNVAIRETNVAIKAPPPAEPPSTQENVTVNPHADSVVPPPEKSGPVSGPMKTDKHTDKHDPVEHSAPVEKPSDKAEKTKPPKAAKSAPTSVQGDSGSFGKEFAKAFAFYLAAIPKLLFGFKARVDDSIEHQNFAAMKGMPLAAWALPPQLLGALIGQVVALGVMIVAGQLAIVSWVIGFVIALAVAVVASIIVGFIFHPVLGWLIKILKGQSDDVSRSNYFVIVMTATGLMQIIGGLGALFGLIPLPFVGIVPVLLSVVTLAISVYVSYRWLQFFQVMKWVPTVVLVLGGLGVLGSLWGAVGVVRAGIASFGPGGGTSASGNGAVATIDLGGGNADAQKAIDEAKAAAEKAIADAKAAQGKGQDAAKDAAKETPKSAKEAAKEAKEAKIAEAKAAKEAAKEAKAAGATKEDYESYVQKREAVEQAIEKNPTVLTRIEGVLPLYKQLHKDMKAVNEKYKKAKGDVIAERLKDAEMYERTVEAVTELHKKILEK